MLNSHNEMKLTDAPYFAREARYALSVNEAGNDRCYFMFLCRVIISSCVTGNHGDGEEHGSVKVKTRPGDVIDPLVYYALKYDHIYPEFLILFNF